MIQIPDMPCRRITHEFRDNMFCVTHEVRDDRRSVTHEVRDGMWSVAHEVGGARGIVI